MNKRVLIIDPHEGVSDRMRERLESAGYEVIVERSGIQGLESARTYSPDMIYVEANMDDVNGFQVCRILKESERYRQIPIVVMSNESSHSHRFWAQQAGADAFLAMPYSVEELVKTTDVLTVSHRQEVA